MKCKDHLIISKMQKKHLAKFSIIYNKNSEKEYRGLHVDIIKGAYDKPT